MASGDFIYNKRVPEIKKGWVTLDLFLPCRNKLPNQLFENTFLILHGTWEFFKDKKRLGNIRLFYLPCRRTQTLSNYQAFDHVKNLTRA
jgi:hypothetical protein